jgi:hypothetical protein
MMTNRGLAPAAELRHILGMPVSGSVTTRARQSA